MENRAEISCCVKIVLPGGARPPEKIVKLLAHLAAELDKDAQELQAGLTAGELPPWLCPRSPIDP